MSERVSDWRTWRYQARLIGVGLGLLLALAPAPPVAAHHSFSAEFDATKPVRLTGVLTKLDWVNPHAFIHINVKKPDGTVESWVIEASTPNTLQRRGLRKADLSIGTAIVVTGFRAKEGTFRSADGAFHATGHDLTLPDGRELLLFNNPK